MTLRKKSLFIITLTVIFFIQEAYLGADNIWQLDDNAPEMSDAKEIEIGKHIDDHIRRKCYLENDPELNDAVNKIMKRLVEVSERKTLPFTCTIIQSHAINAFSAPGGYIYLTYGLLKFTETEDEVAGIIGHEIAHASLKHISRLYCEIKEALSRQANGTDVFANLLILNTHLYEFEQDADTTGVLYAYKAGFNPNGLPDFLERHLDLLTHSRIFGIPGFSSTSTIHSRINHLREYIPTLEKEK
jgi:predicted Zn-dependent protease